MAGTNSNTIRSSFVVETVAGTTNATPAWRTMHVLAPFTDETVRFHQKTLTGNGSTVGDALLDRKVNGKISNAPMTYGLYDVFLESLLRSSFSADVMTNGIGRQTMSFENNFTAGQTGAQTYLRYRGVEVVSGQIKIDEAMQVTQSFDLLGMSSSDTGGGLIAGATYTDPVNKDPFAAQGDVGLVTFGTYTPDGIASMTLDFKYETIDPQGAIGQDALIGIARGGFVPVITVKFYIDSNFAAFRDAARQTTQTPVKVTVNLGSVTLKKYKLEFWTCYVDMAAPDYGGASMFQTVTIMPQYSPGNNGVLTVTRAIA